MQLAELLTPVPFAVTFMLSIVPTTAFDGTVTISDGKVTVSVEVPLLPAGTVSKVGETLGNQLAVSLTVRE